MFRSQKKLYNFLLRTENELLEKEGEVQFKKKKQSVQKEKEGEAS